MADIVQEKHGGFLDKFTGDGLMALFGVRSRGTEQPSNGKGDIPARPGVGAVPNVRGEDRKLAAVCGLYCGTCEAIEETCRACGYQLGLTSHGECVLFRCCVVERGLEHCGLCFDFPCQSFLSQADAIEVQRRYRALLRRREIGTERWIEEQKRTGERHGRC